MEKVMKILRFFLLGVISTGSYHLHAASAAKKTYPQILKVTEGSLTLLPRYAAGGDRLEKEGPREGVFPVSFWGADLSRIHKAAVQAKSSTQPAHIIAQLREAQREAIKTYIAYCEKMMRFKDATVSLAAQQLKHFLELKTEQFLDPDLIAPATDFYEIALLPINAALQKFASRDKNLIAEGQKALQRALTEAVFQTKYGSFADKPFMAITDVPASVTQSATALPTDMPSWFYSVESNPDLQAGLSWSEFERQQALKIRRSANTLFDQAERFIPSSPLSRFLKREAAQVQEMCDILVYNPVSAQRVLFLLYEMVNDAKKLQGVTPELYESNALTDQQRAAYDKVARTLQTLELLLEKIKYSETRNRIAITADPVFGKDIRDTDIFPIFIDGGSANQVNDDVSLDDLVINEPEEEIKEVSW